MLNVTVYDKYGNKLSPEELKNKVIESETFYKTIEMIVYAKVI